MPSTVHLLPSLVNRSSVSSMGCNPQSNVSVMSTDVRRGFILLLSMGSFYFSSPTDVCCNDEHREQLGISHRLGIGFS